MQAKSTKTFQVKEPIDLVWAFLRDPRKVGSCLPGAQITEAVDDRTYKGTITVKVGPITAKYNGEVKIERLDPQNYELDLAGQGQDPGGTGGAAMKFSGKLRSLADGGTEVVGSTEIAVTGRLAQLGSRMMDDVSNHVFEQFTKSFRAMLAEESGGGEASSTPPQPIKAIPLALSMMTNALKRSVGRLFSR